MSAKTSVTSRVSAKVAAKATPVDEQLKKAVERVFEKMATKPGAFAGSRVFFFKASRLLTFLKIHKHKSIPSFATDEEILEFAKKIIAAGYASRCDIAPHTAKLLKERPDVRIDLVQHSQPKAFDPHDVYSVYKWDFEGSQTRLKFMSFGSIALTAAICMIKIWPLWLKIAVYWTSLTLLITMTSLISIRLFLYSVMWIVGFRGQWLFPNLLNDDVPFFEAFKPLFGRGVEDTKDDKTNKDGPAPTWDFGILNALVILGLGIGFCWSIGMFESKSIPDFVVNQKDLYSQFPMLAPPDYDPNADTAADVDVPVMPETPEVEQENSVEIDDSHLDRVIDDEDSNDE